MRTGSVNDCIGVGKEKLGFGAAPCWTCLNTMRSAGLCANPAKEKDFTCSGGFGFPWRNEAGIRRGLDDGLTPGTFARNSGQFPGLPQGLA